MSMVAEEYCYAHFLVYVETLVPPANWIAMLLWTKVVLQQSARTVFAVLQRAPGREVLEQGLKGQLRDPQMRIRNQLAGFCASCVVYQLDVRMLWFRGVEARVPSSALSHLQPLLSRYKQSVIVSHSALDIAHTGFHCGGTASRETRRVDGKNRDANGGRT